MAVRRYTKNIAELLYQREFELLDIDENYVWLEFKDLEGYKYHAYIESFIEQMKVKSDYKLTRFSIRNIFSTDNINNWLFLNNKPITLISNKYEKTNELLRFHCNNPDCNQDFDATWHSIYCMHDVYTNKSGCPYDAKGNTRLSDKNRLSILYPELLKEWDYIKNEKSPEEYSYASSARVWWICSKGHSWKSKIGDRTCSGQGCPGCASKVVTDENRLSVCYPDLALEWDSEKNGDSPDNYTFGSAKKAWWKCNKCGHGWNAQICSRSIGGRGCPGCGRRFLSDVNRLSIIFPDIAAEWDYKLNYPLTPNDVSCGLKKKFWWICPDCGKSYSASCSHRTISLSACPTCKSSHGEKAIHKYLDKHEIFYEPQKRFDDCRNERTLPYDVGIPTENGWILIEFQGMQHFVAGHFGCDDDELREIQFRDNIKKEYALNNNIPLYIIPYSELKNISNILDSIFYPI